MLLKLMNMRGLPLEPAYLCLAVTFGLHLIVGQELYLQKVCRVNKGYTDEVCDNLQQHDHEQVNTIGQVFLLASVISSWVSPSSSP